MKKMNKKGFTIVELTIVIAVIAILAAVLIPTFSGVITKAKMSNVQQVASSLYKEAYALDLADGSLDGVDSSNDAYTAMLSDGNAADYKSYNNYITIITVLEGENSNYKNHIKYSYTPATGGTAEKIEFVYTDGTYTAIFDGSSWTTRAYDTSKDNITEVTKPNSNSTESGNQGGNADESANSQ